MERASAGSTTFTNILLGVSAGSDAGLLGSTTGYTRDPPAPWWASEAPVGPTTSSMGWLGGGGHQPQPWGYELLHP